MKKSAVLLLAILLTIVPILPARAQTAASLDDIVGSFSFSLSPEVPEPGQTVDVSLENYSVDLIKATITWTVNGTRLARGKGLTDVQLTTGPAGSDTNIDVTIETDTQTYERSIKLSPGEVDLLWQGDTYAPPFYKGRTLWGQQSSVTLLAIPYVYDGGTRISPKNLAYKWSLDGQVDGDKSGIGADTYTLPDNYLSQPRRIKVEIMTDSSTVAAKKEITLAPSEPELLVYEDNPLYGIIFGNAVGNNISLREKEVTFTAAPMLFGVSDRNSSSLSYTWSVSGSDNVQKGDKVTYRSPDNGSGSSQVSISVSDKKTGLVSAKKDFLVQFGNTNGL